jgi:hypothetical protein
MPADEKGIPIVTFFNGAKLGVPTRGTIMGQLMTDRKGC